MHHSGSDYKDLLIDPAFLIIDWTAEFQTEAVKKKFGKDYRDGNLSVKAISSLLKGCTASENELRCFYSPWNHPKQVFCRLLIHVYIFLIWASGSKSKISVFFTEQKICHMHRPDPLVITSFKNIGSQYILRVVICDRKHISILPSFRFLTADPLCNLDVTTFPPKGRELPESYSQELFLLSRRWAS